MVTKHMLRLQGRLLTTLIAAAGIATTQAACEGLPGSAKGTAEPADGEKTATAGKPSELDPQIKLAALQAEAKNNHLEAAPNCGHWQQFRS